MELGVKSELEGEQGAEEEWRWRQTLPQNPMSPSEPQKPTWAFSK